MKTRTRLYRGSKTRKALAAAGSTSKLRNARRSRRKAKKTRTTVMNQTMVKAMVKAWADVNLRQDMAIALDLRQELRSLNRALSMLASSQDMLRSRIGYLLGLDPPPPGLEALKDRLARQVPSPGAVGMEG